MKQVLVTGGAGYIGTHTCVELMAQGYSPVVVDNFCNSSPASLDRVRRLTNHELPSYEADIRDTAQITEILKKHNCASVIHFADRVPRRGVADS
ncbi:MAG: SDR family NAD(P)-dependent oxidoreductase [Hyphomonas sp.]|uniref:SDR family NAD(P)-dependent oxidoreductase n=1 Tax=Hyphomonas sp. TaxID=87 RepID=UPI0030032EB5